MRGMVEPLFKVLAEQLEVYGFRYARIAAGLNDSFMIRHHRVGRHRDDRNLAESCFLTDLRSKQKPVLPSQLHVQQNSMGPLALKRREGFL